MIDLTATVVREKRALREAMKARRTALPASHRALDSCKLAENGLSALAAGAPAVVSGFFGIGDELDTVPLLSRLSESGFRICLPVMQGRDKPLLFRAWSPGDAMATAVWGIQEPTADKAVLEPDLLLVPLLAFDRRGWRLGYGGGYYDRTIRSLRAVKPVLAAGLAFDAQEVDAVPHLDYDERLDWILTPSGALKCTA